MLNHGGISWGDLCRSTCALSFPRYILNRPMRTYILPLASAVLLGSFAALAGCSSTEEDEVGSAEGAATPAEDLQTAKEVVALLGGAKR